MTPNPPNNSDKQLARLQSKPQLWVWVLAAASGVILTEKVAVWVLSNFNALPKGWGLDIPTLISIAGAAYAIGQWALTRFKASAMVIEGLKKQVDEIQEDVKEMRISVGEQNKLLTEIRAKGEYHELRIDFNDARINAQEKKNSN